MPLCPGMRLPLIIAAGAAALTPPAIAQTATDAPPGAKLYEARCTACHSLDTNRIGPAHRGVFGRPAGSAPGYACSTTIKASGIVWNAGTLDTWLQEPRQRQRNFTRRRLETDRRPNTRFAAPVGHAGPSIPG